MQWQLCMTPCMHVAPSVGNSCGKARPGQVQQGSSGLRYSRYAQICTQVRVWQAEATSGGRESCFLVFLSPLLLTRTTQNLGQQRQHNRRAEYGADGDAMGNGGQTAVQPVARSSTHGAAV